MATPRAVNPTGAKLLDESKAHPGSLDKSIFDKKSSGSNGATGQGTVNDNYLKECREDNPEPSSPSSETKNQVQLSNCRILTPVEELRLNQEFEMAVDLKKLDPAAASTANFALFATRTRDGKEERAKIWADKPGKPQDDKADPIVVKAKDILATQDDYQLGEKVVFELEASHEGAEAPCKSGGGGVEPAEPSPMVRRRRSFLPGRRRIPVVQGGRIVGESSRLGSRSGRPEVG